MRLNTQNYADKEALLSKRVSGWKRRGIGIKGATRHEASSTAKAYKGHKNPSNMMQEEGGIHTQMSAAEPLILPTDRDPP